MDNFIFEYTDKNIKSIIDEKYIFYLQHIKLDNIYINHENIKWKKYPLVDNYDGTFFHLISKDYINSDMACCPNLIIQCPKLFKYNPLMLDQIEENKKRMICPHKIQCLYILKNYFSNNKLLIWSRMESTPNGKRTRIKLLNQEKKYIVILEKRKNGAILFWTGYPIVYDYKLKKFEKEYLRYSRDCDHYETYYKQGTPTL